MNSFKHLRTGIPVLAVTGLLLLVACGSQDHEHKRSNTIQSQQEPAQPGVSGSAPFPKTEFVPTLESPVSPEKNSIYTPAFLYAWDKTEEALNSQILPNDQYSYDFKLLLNSESHTGALADDEYHADVTVTNGEIVAKASFKKALLFEPELQVSELPILFNGQNAVSAFGMIIFDPEILKNVRILYYSDDDHFVLQLTPAERQHEIILATGLGPYSTLAEGFNLTDELIQKGEKEKKDPSGAWKYEISSDDKISAPMLSFNIATNYSTLEGQIFKTQDGKKHHIFEAWQRTEFKLNEQGAMAESFANIIVDSIGEVHEVKHPKKLVLDNPFLIVLKRTDRKNPYFVMSVNNAELMSRIKGF